jgi:hypothetical protein
MGSPSTFSLTHADDVERTLVMSHGCDARGVGTISAYTRAPPPLAGARKMKGALVANIGLAVLLASTLGCASGSTASAESGTQDLTADTLAGYYELSGDANNDDWIEAVALHADGSYEANMGSDVSNLSGHHFAASGSWTVTQTDSETVIRLGADMLGYQVDAKGDVMKLLPRGGSGKWFTLTKKSLVTLTFNADWSTTQSGPLVASEALLIRYAAARDTCVPPSNGGLFVSALGNSDVGPVTVLTDEFGSKPVKGFLGALGSVPNGKSLTLWFVTGSVDFQGASTCSHPDSKFGANYHFPITPAPTP